MAGGRPLLFDNAEALEAAISDYFESCWEEVWHQQAILDPETKKPTGETEWIQKLDRHGNPILRQMRPYSITGLAVALNTSRQTLLNYEERPEFFDTIKKAKDICEKYLEEGLLCGEIPAAPGIFNAKNNYGWVDKSEIDSNLKVQEMPTIKKDGQDLKFNIGPDAKETDESGTSEAT